MGTAPYLVHCLAAVSLAFKIFFTTYKSPNVHCSDLIGISKRALNNGTYGRLHEVLVNPPVVDVASRTNVVKECSPNARFLAPKAVVCDYGCQKDEVSCPNLH